MYLAYYIISYYGYLKTLMYQYNFYCRVYKIVCLKLKYVVIEIIIYVLQNINNTMHATQ